MPMNPAPKPGDQRVLFVSAATIVLIALLLDLYCYTGEFFGFYDFHFLNFSEGQNSKGYAFLMDYTFIVSILSFGASLAVHRGHRVFSIFGYHVSGALFVWSCVFPRF